MAVRERVEGLELPGDLYGLGVARECEEKKHDGASYIWLAYSIFFFIEPIMRRDAGYWLRQGLIYVFFVGLYVAYVEFIATRVRIGILIAFFVLGIFTMPANPGASCFFIYVAAMLPFSVASLPVLLGTMVVESGTMAIEGYLLPGNRINYIITGFFTVVVGVSNIFVAQQKRADRKLRRAQEENVELAAVAERERIARDLHDVLGHTLSVIVLKAELAGRLMGRDDVRAAVEIAEVEKTARTALAEVREAIGGYRAKGLSAEVEQARVTLDAAGVVLECDSAPPSLRPKEETVLSLAVREAVTNIVRHAGATRCTLRFGRTADGFDLMELTDDGSAGGAVREGNGLRGMRERVVGLGGRLSVEWEAGTRLVVEIPHTPVTGVGQ
ncbi:sensor histidine kinase [Granulicella tundricola]|uniref:Integral membrane sensor signal transduction histidine kinase n=1 Tax=Granulicella tundricola (strain ATCC BAA-1859 / DSM 23138 / MP5ACTX9) TaxID=1198114 RepID=E8WWP5_GRATM|nr:sensor histidine kinase [Granulicella tundricola]ADW67373.1 integral membrane sensor signal transduction histidine kinase [Granulicella tundricola MP5ACTX9]